ncbi:hypothetical protein AJ80_05939 [Polytolypa hystricis UAMH7299]|uniref:Altered inheritance of mitochondria protein 11 n=1 Tax=Polytolypa hystricis (strain UAMH7299) TaxID=1447883 RepID=A0A2B7XZK5_POLH7|nr:hypothetical protein AJ80_05939 [Polytolypa hystricis UAMH7299]
MVWPFSSSKPTAPPSDLPPPPPPPPQPPVTQEQQQPPPPSLQQTLKDRVPNSYRLLFGGGAFFLFSLIVTRRSLARRRISSIPPFHTSAPNYKPKVNGGLEAFEALNIATINVVSLAMLGIGTGMVAFDINTIEDLRRKVRGGLGVDNGPERSEKELEEDFEEWVVGVLNRKTEKEIQQEKIGKSAEASK